MGIANSNGVLAAHNDLNAWEMSIHKTVPFKAVYFARVVYKRYNWMTMFPFLVNFCAEHMRNFIWEQVFRFERVEA